MKEISRRITSYFCKYEEISIYSEEVQFAIYQILWGISTFFIALIGVYIFSGNIQSGIVFSIFFLPLRWAAGGAHAQSRFECISITVCMFIIFTYYYYAGIMQLIVIMAIVAWFIIWMKTPVQTSKHVLTIRQQKRNRESTHKILLIYIAVILYGIRINSKIVNSVFIVLIMVAMLMIAELKFVNGLTIRQSDRYSYLKNKMVGVIVEICLFTCCIAVNTASTHWTYEAEIPRDIQRKFDNM